VVIMLITLSFLVCFILLVPIPSPSFPVSSSSHIDTVKVDSGKVKFFITKIDSSLTIEQSKEMMKESMDFRKNVLAVILTAFGAWVGAGAAYFFGRENLREATQGMLDMRHGTARDRLNQISVGEIPLKHLDWKVGTGATVDEVMTKLKSDPSLWFIPIIDANGFLLNILHGEAVWRTVFSEPNNKRNDKILSIGDVLTAVQKDPQLQKKANIYITARRQQSLGEIHDLLLSKDIYICVVADDQGKPAGYFDTGDVRKILVVG